MMFVGKLKRFLRPLYRREYIKQRALIFRSTRFHHASRADIGNYVYIGPNCVINAEGRLKIGDGTILGPEVVILTSNHDFRSGELLPYDVYDVHRPVSIGAGVWIGYRAMIAPGVTIGDGAIVAMGAVVSRDVEAGAVVAGNPAIKICGRDQTKITEMVKTHAFMIRKYWPNLPKRKVTKNI